MSAIELYLFGRNEITGRDFRPFEEGEIRTIVTSPDDENALKIYSRENNSMLLDNPGNVPFDFTVTGYTNNDLHVYAMCQYNPQTRSIMVNNNWTINENGIENKLVSNHGSAEVSRFLNIRFHSSNFNDNKMSRIDICLNKCKRASLFFTPVELLFINLDGNDVEEDLTNQTNRLIAMGSDLNMPN